MATSSSSGSRKAPTVEDLEKKIDVLQQDIGELTGLMAEMGKAQAAKLSDEAEAQARKFREKGEQAAAEAKAQVEHLQSNANDFIRTQPATAIGMAAGLGFLVGMLMTRR